MLNFIHDNFLLDSRTAQRLYHQYAKSQPIIDYHSHLHAADVAINRRFENLFEIWLEGDHYKWRAMRANGISERLCAGSASPQEKFLAWAHTVPHTLRNPLYHWTHLELKRYFDIDDLLNDRTAESIWQRANKQLQTDEFTAQNILRKFQVRVICTSDDPADSLEHHIVINSRDLGFRIYPSFRPDKSLLVDQPDLFNPWVDRVEAASNVDASSLAGLLRALDVRHAYFHDNGGRISDHGLPRCYANPCSETEAAQIYARARARCGASPVEQERFASFMMVYFGHLDAKRGWTKQLHLGPIRNLNTRKLSELGPDTGFDSIGDFPQALALSAYLDRLEAEHALPRMIIYNSNPADSYVFATAAGNFQDESTAGKIQFGSAWWFLDQKEGIERQLNVLSSVGLLSRFVGMVTDSRSFMSFPRHEYFRRVLSNLLGNDMEKGDLPNDEALVGGMVRRICFQNARDYLGLELAPSASPSDTAAMARTT
ncbi:MAG: glucuronate isomerase [Acidobacteria bacterium]|nr:MAG: glucuronate isomerase [Acidobacteriota bacterium]PYY10001.1 MAG: glucuronate isomerase [Acidobacteriota bacterium]